MEEREEIDTTGVAKVKGRQGGDRDNRRCQGNIEMTDVVRVI